MADADALLIRKLIVAALAGGDAHTDLGKHRQRIYSPARAKRRAESGTKMANSRAAHSRLAVTGWVSGHAASGPGVPGLPNNDRVAVANALSGFHSQIARSQTGIRSVGTNALDTMVSGSVNGARLAAVDAERIAIPRYVPTHASVYRNSRSRPIPANVCPTPLCGLQPTISPYTIRTSSPYAPMTPSAPLWPS